MWVICKAGFFSVVQKNGESDLTIRARVKKDLTNLLPYLPGKNYEIFSTPKADYEYRVRCSHGAWAKAMADMSREVNYDNFKSEIGKSDPVRAHILHTVWDTLYDLGLEVQKKARVAATGLASYIDQDDWLDRFLSQADEGTLLDTRTDWEPHQKTLSGYFRMGKD